MLRRDPRMVERKHTNLAKARKAVRLVSIGMNSILTMLCRILGSNVDTARICLRTSDGARLFYLDSWISVLTSGQIECKREANARHLNHETVVFENNKMTLARNTAHKHTAIGRLR